MMWIGGYVLNEEELTALQQMYDDNMIKQLTSKGLKMQGKITIEEVNYYLKASKMVDEANDLKEKLESFIKCKWGLGALDKTLFKIMHANIAH